MFQFLRDIRRVKRPVLLLLSFIISFFAFGQERVWAAGPGSIQAPFPQGETWYVCQGYHDGNHNNSNGDDGYALDLVASAADVSPNGCLPGANSSANRTVTAPASGTVYWSSATAGSMCINLSGGGSLEFAHIFNRPAAGTQVTAGNSIGTVAPSGQASNNGVAHIHIQAQAGSNCAGNTVPFSAAQGFRFCGNSDMPDKGGNYQYHGGAISSADCSSTPTDSYNYRNDIFYATGSSWNIAYGGGPWQPRRTSEAMMPMLLGDFDRDRADDVFQATGSVFRVSYGGTSGWVKLRDSAAPMQKLVMGDFDGDTYKDDVLYATGSAWNISYRGGPWQTVRPSEAMMPLLVGDFNRDKTDDIFQATGSVFRVSYGASSDWVVIRHSAAPMDKLLVGDFNGDGYKDDIFYATGSAWNVSIGGGAWETRRMSEAMMPLLVGEFNKGADDIFQATGSVFRVSYGASSGWVNIRSSAAPMDKLLVGDFD